MNKNALYALLLVGLGAYYGYDTYYPEYVGWEVEIAKLQQDIAQARQTAPRLAELSQEEVALKTRLRASLEKLPSGAELADLMVMVLPIYEKAGIASNRIISKNIAAATEKIIYRVHPIQIGGIKDVSMQTIVRLLFELRSFYRIVNVQSFGMTRTGPDQYDVSFNLETYSYIEAEGTDLGLDDAAAPAAEVGISVSTPEPETPAVATETSSVSPAASVDSGVAPVDTSAAVVPATETGAVSSAPPGGAG